MTNVLLEPSRVPLVIKPLVIKYGGSGHDRPRQHAPRWRRKLTPLTDYAPVVVHGGRPVHQTSTDRCGRRKPFCARFAGD